MNTIRTVCVFFLFVLLNKTVVAQNNQPMGKLSLKQCVDIGLANNLQVQQGDLTMQQSKITLNQSRLNLLPSLYGNIGTDIRQGRNIDQATNTYINNKATYGNYGLSSDVVLFNGLSMQNIIKRDALAYEASKMDWQQLKDNITIRIILAYLDVLTNQDQLEQSQSQLTYTKNQVDRLEALNKEGAVSPSQLSDLKGDYANSQLAIISGQYALQSSKITLCEWMNIPYDKNMELEKIDAESYATKYEQTPDSIYQISLKQFSLIRAADLRTQSAIKGVKAQKGRLFPTLSLSGNYGTAYASTFSSTTKLSTSQDITSTDYVLVNGVPSPVVYKVPDYRSDKISYANQLNNNRSSSISLNLNIPFFNSFQQRNNVKLAKIILKNNELSAANTKTQLQRSIELAYIDMTTSSERYKVLLEQTAAYKESFRAADIRFTEGLGTSVDYLFAKGNLDRANLSLIAAKYDYVLRTKILDYYQGKQLW